MFTGIIKNLGVVTQTVTAKQFQLQIAVPAIGLKRPQLQIGESISVNGVCLTLVAKKSNGSTLCCVFDIGNHTKSLTAIAKYTVGKKVNIERAATPSTLLGGHWVQGHVDCLGKITGMSYDKETRSHTAIIAFPVKFRKYVIEQGSITVDGISLTIIACKKNYLTCCIIPKTMKVTNFQFLKKSSLVHLEFDYLAKLIVRRIGK